MEGGTSNLMNHLETKHRVEYNKIVPSETRKKKLSPFQAKKCSPDHANMITKMIAEFVKRLVDGKGFQQLLNYLEPGYKVPSRPHVTTTLQ